MVLKSGRNLISIINRYYLKIIIHAIGRFENWSEDCIRQIINYLIRKTNVKFYIYIFKIYVK